MLWLSKSTLCQQTQRDVASGHKSTGDLSTSRVWVYRINKWIIYRMGKWEVYNQYDCSVVPKPSYLDRNGKSTLCHAKPRRSRSAFQQTAKSIQTTLQSGVNAEIESGPFFAKMTSNLFKMVPHFWGKRFCLRHVVQATAEKDLLQDAPLMPRLPLDGVVDKLVVWPHVKSVNSLTCKCQWFSPSVIDYSLFLPSSVFLVHRCS